MLKSLVESCKNALDEKRFSQALKHAKEALKIASGKSINDKELSKLNLLAGKAALELKHEEEAIGYLEKCIEYDDDLMAPLMSLAGLYMDLAKYDELIKVKEKQIELASRKGKLDKAAQFLCELAYTQEHQTKNFEKAMGTLKRFLSLDMQGQLDDSDLRVKALESVVRIQYSQFFRDAETVDFVRSCTIELIAHPSRSEDMNVKLAQQFICFLLGFEQDENKRLDQVQTFCREVIQNVKETGRTWGLCCAVILSIGEASEDNDETVFKLASDVIVASGEPKGSTDLLEVVQAKWRAYSLLCNAFIRHELIGESRHYSDQAVISLKQAQKLREEQLKLQQQKKAQKKQVVVSFNSHVILDEKRQTHKDAMSALSTYLTDQSQLVWLNRALVLIRWYFQGTTVTWTKSLYAALRCVEMGSGTERGCVQTQVQYAKLEYSLNAIGLEVSSHLIFMEGNRKSSQFAQKLGSVDESSCFPMGVYHMFSGNVEEAITLLSCKKKSECLAALAYAFFKKGDYSMAKENILAALKTTLKPDLDFKSQYYHGSDAIPKVSMGLPWYVSLYGQVAFELGEVDVAQNALLKAAKLDAELPQAFLYLGKIYEAKGDIVRGQKCLEKAVELDPKEGQVLSLLRDMYTRNKQMTLLVNMFQKALRSIQDIQLKGGEVASSIHFECWLGLGRFQYHMDRYADAENSFQRALAIDYGQEKGHVWQHLGDTYMKMGRLTAAVRAFETSMENLQEMTYSKYRLGCILMLIHEYSRSTKMLQEAYEREKKPVIAFNLGKASLQYARELALEARYELARDVATNAVSLLGTHKSELQYFQCARKLQGDLFSFLSCHLPPNQNDIDDDAHTKCMRSYTMYIHAEPWNARAWASVANHIVQHVQQTETRTKETENVGRRAGECAVVLDPRNGQLWNLLGAMFLLCCMDKEGFSHEQYLNLSRHALVRAVQLNPTGCSDAWCNLSLIFERAGLFDAALHALIQGASTNRDDAAAIWGARARIQIKKGENRSKILSVFQCAIDNAGDGICDTPSLRPLLEFGRYFLDQGNLTKAEWLELEQVIYRYVKRDPRNKVAQYLLGLAFQARGHTEMARQSFQQAQPRFGEINISLLDAPTKSAQAELLLLQNTVSEQDRLTLKYIQKRSRDVLEEAYHGSSACDSIALSALGKGNVEDARFVLPKVQDSEVVSKILMVESKTHGCIPVFLSPWSTSIWTEFGKAEMKRNRFKNGEHCCEVAQTLASSQRDNYAIFQAMMVKSMILYERNDLDKLYGEVVSLYHASPYDANAMRLFAGTALSLGIVRRDNEKLRVAHSLFKILYQSNYGQSVQTEQKLYDLLGLCEVCLALPDNEEDLQLLVDEFASLANAQTSKAIQIQALTFQARLDIQKGNVEAGNAGYIKALTVNPYNAHIWMEFGYFLFSQDRMEAFHHCMKMAATPNPEDGEDLNGGLMIPYSLVQILYIAELISINKSAGAIKQLARDHESNYVIQLVRGWISLLQGDNKNRKAGITCLKNVLEMKPGHPLAESLLQLSAQE